MTGLGHIARPLIAGIAGLLVYAASASGYTTATAPTSAGPSIAEAELVAATGSGSSLRGIGTDGLDGVWFAENTAPSDQAYMAHYRPTQPGLTRIGVTQLSNFGVYINGIAPGLGETEWFTNFYDNEISHITAGGKLVSKTLPAKNFNSEPEALVLDRQGNAWFTARGHGCSLGRLSAAGKFSEYDVGGDCSQLTIGPDGNIWVALYTANLVREVSATTGAILATYNLRLPQGIATVGQYVFVTEHEPGVVARIAPSGDVTEYVLPGSRTASSATAGPDGAVWFIDYQPGPETWGIGRLTPSGAFSDVSLPHSGGPAAITATNDAIYLTYDGTTPGLMRIPLSNLVQPEEASYVALGDSYSSGEGNPPYEAGTTPPPQPDPENPASFNTCHRSESAYGPLLDGARSLGASLFMACSGAVTEDLFNENPKNAPEPAQLSWLRANDTVVTLTIGGNDGGFPWVLEHCVAGPRASWPFNQLFGCSKSKALKSETELRLKALGGVAIAYTPSPDHRPIRSFTEVLGAVHAQTRAPNARIIIGGYPKLFGASTSTYEVDHLAPSGYVCQLGTALGVPLVIDHSDAVWLNSLATQLDKKIQEAVTAAQAEGVQVTYATPKFGGHGLCDTGEAWIRPVELDGQNELEPGSFHPTVTGQQLGYEAAFSLALK